MFKDLLQDDLEAELDHHLSYSKYDWKNKKSSNSRNGHTRKRVRSTKGNVELQIPRDTGGTFEPVIIKKHERQVNPSIDDRIISMYAKGMSNQDIYRHMKEIYKIEVSSEMVSRITDKIIPLVHEWQNRPLDEAYPIVFLDGIVFKVREEGQVKKKTAYLVQAITLEGTRELLGIWLGKHETSKFWLGVASDLQNRGVKDILIACVDGLNGFNEAITSVFPNTEIQRCIVHQIRNSTKYVNWKDRKEFCSDLKAVYTAPNEEAALLNLDKFGENWGKKYAYAVKSWRTNWADLATFLKYPQQIRKIIYTTNAIEGLNRQIRKITKTKSSFPTENSLLKLLYLIVMDSDKKRKVKDWSTIMNQMIVYFGERITKYI
jgi:transposase-like protein